MTLQKDTCPYCKTALGHMEMKRIQRSQQKWGWVGVTFGLIGAGLGVYFGVSA